MQSIEQELCQLILLQMDEQNQNDKEDLLEKNLIDDLGFDSIQLVDLIFSLEEKFNLQITDMSSWLYSLSSVRELINYVEINIEARERRRDDALVG